SLTSAVDRPVALSNSALVSSPTQAGSRLAAVIVTPLITTPGNAIPAGPVQLKSWTSPCTALAIASGSAGRGVSTLIRSVMNVPLAVSTGAALIPEPPMSMPSTCTALPPLGSAAPGRGGTAEPGHSHGAPSAPELPGRGADIRHGGSFPLLGGPVPGVQPRVTGRGLTVPAG